MTEPGTRSGGYARTLVIGLLASTAATVGVSRTWVSATARIDGYPTLTASVSGADMAPLAAALGVVLLASYGAVIATRGWVRTGLGTLIVAASLVVLVSTVAPGDSADLVEQALSARGWSGGDYSTTVAYWRWLVAAGAALSVGAGIAVVRHGREWSTLGERYDAPNGSEAPAASTGSAESAGARAAGSSGSDLWREIDRGHDPTQLP